MAQLSHHVYISVQHPVLHLVVSGLSSSGISVTSELKITSGNLIGITMSVHQASSALNKSFHTFMERGILKLVTEI